MAFAQPTYDLLIQNGRVLDGTGNPWFFADIALRDDRIVALGNLQNAEAERIIDATGLYVAPGFIDTHSHAASGLTSEDLSRAEPLLMQGITTVLINPDGGGDVDLEAQRTALLADGLGLNVAQFVPHGAVRRAVMGSANRAPTPDELKEMQALVERGMEAGAFGLSSGLFYAPGSFAENAELVELAKIVAAYDGVYQSHIRDESNYTIGLLAAVEEVIDVAQEAELPGIVTHVKALGPPVWGLADTVVARIEQARASGIEVYADQYPYEASATGLTAALIPRWAEAGGRDSLLARIADPALRPRLLADMTENLTRRGGAERIQFRFHEADRSIEGRTLADVAQERNQNPLETALALISEGTPGIVSFNMHPDDVQTFMRQPWTMTSSDGGLVPMHEGVPHPRNYGTFPRKIRRYVTEEQVVDLAHAVRSMTSLPATVFRIRDRGTLRVGALADLVVFDLNRLRDHATFQQPHQLSEGIVHVFINGKPVVQNERLMHTRAGHVLTRRSSSP